MRSNTYDVLIIGAGASGLAAASCLARAGRAALVLEARLHIGGRVWSHHEPELPVPIELGAEFIHGRAEPTFSLLARWGGAAIDAVGENWSVRNGKLERQRDLFGEVQRAIKRTRALERKDISFLSFLERHLAGTMSDEARRFALTLVEGFDAADPGQASARAIVEEWSGGGSVQAPQFRPLGGYSRLLGALAAELRDSSVALQLNTSISTIRWKRGSVQIEGSFLGQPLRCDAPRAIVTLPLGVLQTPADEPGAVRFMPRLVQKHTALKQLATGPVIKVVLRFRTAFWEKLHGGRYSKALFLHAPEAPFPTFWTALPLRVPLLVAWAAGPRASRWAGAAKARIIADAVKSLEHLFGKSARVARRIESAWVHDWQSDPYARGAYSYVTVGGAKAREALASPVLDTLFFAGEAADIGGDAGTVAGALRSGTRAAWQVLASLKK